MPCRANGIPKTVSSKYPLAPGGRISSCRDAMPRVFSPTGFNVNSPLTLGFESGFPGFSGLQRTSSVWVQWSFVEDYLIPFFSPLRNASAKGLAMKAACNNNLPTHTNDVIINPENPDSKIGCCARNFLWRLWCIGMICPENNSESGFIGLQRTSSFWVQWSFVEDYFIPFFSPLRDARIVFFPTGFI